jgi:hypothetical protein
MKKLNYYCNFSWFDPKDNLFTWALSHSFDINFDQNNPDIVLTDNDLDPQLVKYKNSKIIYYTGEPFLSWSGDINRSTIYKALTFFDFEDSFFGRVPLILLYNYEYYKNGYINDYEFLLKKQTKRNIIPQKFCSFVARGNGYPSCPRKYFFEKLSNYKFVNSHGSYLNNSPLIPMGNTLKYENSLFKVRCISDYKFNICFENSHGCVKSPNDITYVSDSGLLSEKIYEALLSNTIPIYWGNKDIHKDLNTNRFINYYDYNDFDAMIDRIIEIDNDDKLFLDYVNQNYVLDIESSIFKKEYIIDLIKKICS